MRVSPATVPLGAGSTLNTAPSLGSRALCPLYLPRKNQVAGQLASSPAAAGSQPCVSRQPMHAKELQTLANDELANGHNHAHQGGKMPSTRQWPPITGNPGAYFVSFQLWPLERDHCF